MHVVPTVGRVAQSI